MITDDERSGLLSPEPIFHRRRYIWDGESFEAEIAPDFREIGASGTWHEREVIKDDVLARPAGEQPGSLVDGFRIEDAHLVELTADVAQVRYTLHGQGRVTRRVTTYRRTASGWQAVFHQGTVVEGAAPLPPQQFE